MITLKRFSYCPDDDFVVEDVWFLSFLLYIAKMKGEGKGEGMIDWKAVYSLKITLF